MTAGLIGGQNNEKPINYKHIIFLGFSLEHPQGVGIVGIAGTVGNKKIKYTHSASLSFENRCICLLCNWYYFSFVNNPES